VRHLLGPVSTVVLVSSTGVAVVALVVGALPLVVVSRTVTLRGTLSLALGLAATWLEVPCG
jgi:hypothetical protein